MKLWGTVWDWNYSAGTTANGEIPLNAWTLSYLQTGTLRRSAGHTYRILPPLMCMPPNLVMLHYGVVLEGILQPPPAANICGAMFGIPATGAAAHLGPPTYMG
eukprot:scaffold132050_cov74-Attheya_sp.AAC.2